MDVNAALLESWDRQCRIVNSVANLVTPELKDVKPSPDGMTLEAQLAHIHQVRRFWLWKVDAERIKGLEKLVADDWTTVTADLPTIKRSLEESALAVRGYISDALLEGKEGTGGYDHPVLFLQHMVWHEVGTSDSFSWAFGWPGMSLRKSGKSLTFGVSGGWNDGWFAPLANPRHDLDEDEGHKHRERVGKRDKRDAVPNGGWKQIREHGVEPL